MNVRAAIRSFYDFLYTNGGSADMVYSNGAVLPHAVLLLLFEAVPEAHPYLQAIAMSLVASPIVPTPYNKHHLRTQRRSDARATHATNSPRDPNRART